MVPWAALVELVAPFSPEGRRGSPPFSVKAMLRVRFMQQCFTLSEPLMKGTLHDMPVLHEFAGRDNWAFRLPDESTILQFHYLLEKHKLAAQVLSVRIRAKPARAA